MKEKRRKKCGHLPPSEALLRNPYLYSYLKNQHESRGILNGVSCVIVSVCFSVCACFLPQKPWMKKNDNKQYYDTQRQAWHSDKKACESNSYSGLLLDIC